MLSQHNSTQGTRIIEYFLKAISLEPLSVGYVASQADANQVYFKQTREIYSKAGADLDFYFDLETGFSPHSLEELLSRPVIHLSGGDTFRFLKSLKLRGVEYRFKHYVESGGGIIGVSAGAMLMTPSIRSAILCGDENHVELDNLTGLSLVSFLFVPHINKQNLGLNKAIELSTHFDSNILFCDDEAGLIIIDDQKQYFGSPLFVKDGRATICHETHT